ncbi:hypothetical protein M9H77_35822 [Catharanthus roseus]|uniref:Uncharacterized protein n=1 Tax=Catharanthus roseus TaxID=4058 RepID=A0ACB9ZUB2_CATRO|nr:hypothetical protein M9H77_35822 [Catharanthus roseus]
MVRPSGRREGDDLEHSTSDLSATPTHLAPGFHHGTGEPGSSAQPSAILFRSRPPLQPHLSHTLMSYEPYGSSQPSSHPTDTVCDPYLHAPTIRPRIPYRSATQEPILEFIDRVCEGDIGLEGDRGVGEEQERVRSLHIEGEGDEKGDDDDDNGDGDGDGGGDDDQDEADDVGDEEHPVLMVPVAHASGSYGRPRHEKGKGLTGSFMSVMSKFVGSRNKRSEVAHEVPALTQKKKKPAEAGPVDPELIPSYGGHDRGSLKFRSRYMTLTGCELTDAHKLKKKIQSISYLKTNIFFKRFFKGIHIFFKSHFDVER